MQSSINYGLTKTVHEVHSAHSEFYKSGRDRSCTMPADTPRELLQSRIGPGSLRPWQQRAVLGTAVTEVIFLSLILFYSQTLKSFKSSITETKLPILFINGHFESKFQQSGKYLCVKQRHNKHGVIV